MGGPGSGRWKQHTRARTIEECVIFLDTSTFRRNFRLRKPVTEGTLTWASASGDVSGKAHHSLHVEGDRATLTLIFTAGAPSEREIVNHRLHLTPMELPSGGRKWFFVCDGCDRRACKLYLPKDETRFGCRRCHHLSFRSCQESRSLAGLYRRLQRLGVLPDWDRQDLRPLGGQNGLSG